MRLRALVCVCVRVCTTPRRRKCVCAKENTHTHARIVHDVDAQSTRRRAPLTHRLDFPATHPASQTKHTRAPQQQQQYQQRGARTRARESVCVCVEHTRIVLDLSRNVCSTPRRRRREHTHTHRQTSNRRTTKKQHALARARIPLFVDRRGKQPPSQTICTILCGEKTAARELSSARSACVCVCVTESFACECVLAVWREKLLRSMSRVKMCNSRHVVTTTRDFLAHQQNNNISSSTATATLCPSVRACAST